MKSVRHIAAALKAIYRPVFMGEIESEVELMSAVAKKARADADSLTGTGRAVLGVTKGRGE